MGDTKTRIEATKHLQNKIQFDWIGLESGGNGVEMGLRFVRVVELWFEEEQIPVPGTMETTAAQ